MTNPDKQTSEGAGFGDRIDRYLRESGASEAGTTVLPLTADASDRRYFRVIFSGGDSMVLALHAGTIDVATLPFVNVASLLRQVPLPVPALVGHSDALGILALEDLGDVTLQAHLGAASPSERVRLYRQAVGFIERLQRRGAEIDPNGYLPYRSGFDVEKLTWELDFFVKHFVEGYRDVRLSGPERAALTEEFSSFAGELASEPRVLCHRDYHSRNLMLHAGSLYIIDFQDARMGPDTYDLVSLLRDSYVDVADRDLDDLVAYFLALKGRNDTEPALPDIDRASREFRRRFDMMAVQRNLKALGTFGYQTMMRRNHAYIQSMPRTLRYVRANLTTYPRFARLRELLARHIEELR